MAGAVLQLSETEELVKAKVSLISGCTIGLLSTAHPVKVATFVSLRPVSVGHAFRKSANP